MTMPSLPKATYYVIGSDGVYDADQMRKYGQKCREAAPEEAINCYSPDNTATSYIKKIEELK